MAGIWFYLTIAHFISDYYKKIGWYIQLIKFGYKTIDRDQ